MVIRTNEVLQEASEPQKAILWDELYPLLRSYATYLVYSSPISSWKGQEEDIADDIVQETMRRLLEQSCKAEHGEVAPIRYPKNLMFVVAGNYWKDLKRRDRRIVRNAVVPSEQISSDEQVDPQEVASEHIYHMSLFKTSAREIVKFPEKQRRALLTDLANRMSFTGSPTDLQTVFLELGVRLEEYRQPPSSDIKERARFSALLCYAYRRIGKSSSLKQAD